MLEIWPNKTSKNFNWFLGRMKNLQACEFIEKVFMKNSTKNNIKMLYSASFFNYNIHQTQLNIIS